MSAKKVGPTKRIVTHSHRTGLPKSRGEIKSSVGSYLRMANAGKSKRKPSLPKLPWEGPDEPTEAD